MSSLYFKQLKVILRLLLLFILFTLISRDLLALQEGGSSYLKVSAHDLNTFIEKYFEVVDGNSTLENAQLIFIGDIDHTDEDQTKNRADLILKLLSYYTNYTNAPYVSVLLEGVDSGDLGQEFFKENFQKISKIFKLDQKQIETEMKNKLVMGFWDHGEHLLNTRSRLQDIIKGLDSLNKGTTTSEIINSCANANKTLSTLEMNRNINMQEVINKILEVDKKNVGKIVVIAGDNHFVTSKGILMYKLILGIEKKSFVYLRSRKMATTKLKEYLEKIESDDVVDKKFTHTNPNILLLQIKEKLDKQK
ncbi:MAG: hypothetical protein HQK49_09735 [Oligoflexia bacterium]|nr:hypothetical protein [Oligoflexia bacterium]